VGYGKSGSVEGWCSGGGIAQLARERKDDPSLSAKSLAQAARNGDKQAIDLFRNVGDMLGKALAISIDLLNLETIVIGSIFNRCEDLIRPAMEQAMGVEALTQSLGVCCVKPSGLGEQIGDIAAMTVAMEGLKGNL
jgi:glucokinase